MDIDDDIQIYSSDEEIASIDNPLVQKTLATNSADDAWEIAIYSDPSDDERVGPPMATETAKEQHSHHSEDQDGDQRITSRAESPHTYEEKGMLEAIQHSDTDSALVAMDLEVSETLPAGEALRVSSSTDRDLNMDTGSGRTTPSIIAPSPSSHSHSLNSEDSAKRTRQGLPSRHITRVASS
jgi:hypothetical protein